MAIISYQAIEKSMQNGLAFQLQPRSRIKTHTGRGVDSLTNKLLKMGSDENTRCPEKSQLGKEKGTRPNPKEGNAAGPGKPKCSRVGPQLGARPAERLTRTQGSSLARYSRVDWNVCPDPVHARRVSLRLGRAP